MKYLKDGAVAVTDCIVRKEVETKNRLVYKRKFAKYFAYSKKTNSLINSYIDNYTEVDKQLGLNQNKRVYIPIDLNADNDVAYGYLIQAIRNTSHRLFKDSAYEIKGFSGTDFYNQLLNYEVYKSGRITIGKNSVKLFRFLQQHSNLPEGNILHATNLRCSKLYLCISRNITDFLHCSTNQSYASCYSLHSEYGNWTGIPSLLADSNRVMLFITTGKVKKNKLDGSIEFKHLRILCRRWANYSHKHSFFAPMAGVYGDDHFTTKAFNKILLKKLRINLDEDRHIYSGIRKNVPTVISKWEVCEFNNYDYSTSFPYYDGHYDADYLGLRRYYITNSSDTRNHMFLGLVFSSVYLDKNGHSTSVRYKDKYCSFYYEDSHGYKPQCGINRCIVNRITKAISSLVCSSCEDDMPEDDYYTTRNGSRVCYDCYCNFYFTCEDCGDVVHNDDYCNVVDYGCVCITCVNSNDYWECTHCNRMYSSNATHYDVEGDSVCDICISNYYYCDECNEYFNDCTIVDNGSHVCDSCLEECYTKCDCCNEYVRNEDVDEVMACNDCQQHNHRRTNEVTNQTVSA